MNEAKNIQEPTKKAWSIGVVVCRLFCGHFKWVDTGETLGSKLHKHNCVKCGKSIYRDKFNAPISMLP